MSTRWPLYVRFILHHHFGVNPIYDLLFVPATRDARCLRQVLLDGPAEDLWIWKPSNSNNGKGVQVLTSVNMIRKMEGETCGEGSNVCVQKYIRRPLLIDGLKVRLRFGGNL